jgi:hypothetical protein
MRTKRVNLSSKRERLHIEAPGCIVNIHTGMVTVDGAEVTSVEVIADGDRYAGEPPWWIDDDGGRSHYHRLRIVKQACSWRSEKPKCAG